MYLITYSRANLEIVPTREAFARIILDKFENAVPACPWRCTLSYGCETERSKTLAAYAKLYQSGVQSESEL